MPKLSLRIVEEKRCLPVALEVNELANTTKEARDKESKTILQ